MLDYIGFIGQVTVRVRCEAADAHDYVMYFCSRVSGVLSGGGAFVIHWLWSL